MRGSVVLWFSLKDEYSGFNGTMCLPGLHCTVAVNVDHPLCDAPLLSRVSSNPQKEPDSVRLDH